MTSRATRFPSASSIAAELPSGFILGMATEDIRSLDDDVEFVRESGVDSCNFCLSWRSVQPDGSGRLSDSGLAFYDRLLDRMLVAGISPTVTLFRGDIPSGLAGGWTNRDTARRFGDLAFELGERFGDRVDRWVTLADPSTSLDDLPAAHNLLLGHGYALQGLRGADVRGLLGLTNVFSPVEPASSRDDDVVAARLFDAVYNRIFADPVLLGCYPAVPDHYAELLAPLFETDASDLAVIAAPIDFYTMTYRSPTRVVAAAAASRFETAAWPEFPITQSGWPIAPEYLETALAELGARYGQSLPAVFVMDAGASFAEKLVLDERTGERVVADARRIDYLAEHVEAALRATSSGGAAASVNLSGYYFWHSGLVYVDPDTKDRTPKDSYRWLQQLAGDRTG